MSRYLCQSCSTEQESWSGSCSNCGSNRAIQLEAEDTMVGRKVAGKYKILRKLGQGGMGAVYEAEVEGIGQRVALKFLSNAFQMDSKTAFRFLNEAKGLARLSHPNAIKLMDFAQDEEGRLFFSMEYVEGVDLKKFINEQGRVSPRDAIQVAVQVADALGHAHVKGVIHRDLKPENIMVRKWAGGLFVTVLDFGLARLVEEGASRLTNTGTLMGSPRYMSPEQAFGKEVDQRTDIYSLGIVLFEMITGNQPFVAEGHMEILQKQREMPMPHLWEVSGDLEFPEIDAVLQQATCKAPSDRFTTMEEFAAPLEQILSTLARAPQVRSPLLDQKGVPSDGGTGRPPTPAPRTPIPLERSQQIPRVSPMERSQQAIRQPSRSSFGNSQQAMSAPGLVDRPPSNRSTLWMILGGVGALAVLATAAVFFLRPSSQKVPVPDSRTVQVPAQPPAPPPVPPPAAPPVAAPTPPPEAPPTPPPEPPTAAPPAAPTPAVVAHGGKTPSTATHHPKKPPAAATPKHSGIVDPFAN